MGGETGRFSQKQGLSMWPVSPPDVWQSPILRGCEQGPHRVGRCGVSGGRERTGGDACEDLGTLIAQKQWDPAMWAGVQTPLSVGLKAHPQPQAPQEHTPQEHTKACDVLTPGLDRGWGMERGTDGAVRHRRSK